MTPQQQQIYKGAMQKSELVLNDINSAISHMPEVRQVYNTLSRLRSDLSKDKANDKYLENVIAMIQLMKDYIKDIEKFKSSLLFYARKSSAIAKF